MPYNMLVRCQTFKDVAFS